MRPPHPAARADPRGESGQTTVLVLGLTAIIVALLSVMLAATSVTLQARRLQSLADGAALAGAHTVALAADQPGRLDLDEADVRASVHSYLSDVGAAHTVPGLQSVAVRLSPDGTSVEVRLSAQAGVVPPRGPLAGSLPVTVGIERAGDSRTVMRR